MDAGSWSLESDGWGVSSMYSNGTSAGRGTVASAAGRGYRDRTLHLIDIENLAGSPCPSLGHVRWLRDLYRQQVGVSGADQVVVACSHLAFTLAGFGWLDARHVVRSGPDGADLELLDVICCEHVADRFARIAIASGDGIFADAAARLAGHGCHVTVISRRRSLSRRLALAAHEVIYLDSGEPGAPPATALAA
jgi:hypothetical protein